ncbi:hypothetical protein [Salisediminibacterium beveridgei]|uniref:Uncharacterized protein n=1 Tax=Salisediminibacterium beveridgei TaxID=632773 RepID=A0A1D7QZN0_9BACI|nr:hypothetical protein [Salisediminibacterium beveridgei]AOM84467.1 hypothetical protein BBEV_3151 [Salisediminibacterium beveridgei]
MAMFVSDELNLGSKLEQLGVFDSLMDEDSNFFINIIRLRNTEVPEFKNSYENINSYFMKLGILLKASNNTKDKLFRSAVSMFDFSEVRGINLGFSKGKGGSGFGTKLSNQIVKDASEIIKSGSDQPEIFHLTSLFEENVGPDRLSDMIATLIHDDIVRYTKRIYEEVGINENNYPGYTFNSGILINPYKDCELLLLPIDILHELPIASSWEDIDRVVNENETIKREMSEVVGKEWSKLASSKKKSYIKDFIFMKPDLVSKVIDDYKSTEVTKYDVYQNINYKINRLINIITNEKEKLHLSKKNSYESAKEIINEYKKWIENQKGYTIFSKGINTRNEEKIIQKTLHGIAAYYCKINDIDISPESNAGRGPVDFKISRGEDKTVVEIKLTSNPKTLHGFEVQIEEYAKSEGTDNKIFLLIDNGSSSNRINEVMESHKKRLESGENPATVIQIDAKFKESASKYLPNSNS